MCEIVLFDTARLRDARESVYDSHWSACSVGCCDYLVDPASSHMLVSKIKPCMSKYTP